ncbi:MAG: hypothetical protein D6754_10440 [Alphaproteobacteria bacterium]|nr:MAG: hypothetical protein D6754_10440 [Alphaproteobacteria bacterium]
MSAILLSAATALGGCTQGEFLSWDPDTPAEKTMREKSEALQSTVGEGAVTGIALGAVLGGLIGGGAGAFRGAEIGRLLGAGAGTYVRGLQEQYATREEVLAAVARDIDATNLALESTIADMRRVLAERRAALAAARAAGREEIARARSRRALAEMNGAIKSAEQREAFFGEARTLLVADASAPPVDPYLAGLSARIAAMRTIADKLAKEL